MTILQEPMDARRARRLAGIGGVLYLLIIVIGALGEAVVRGSIIVPGHASETAANLRSMEWLWRLGVAGEVVLLAAATGLALILYVLLSRVNKRLAQLAVLFNLVCIAIEGVAAVSLATALAPLSDAEGVFSDQQSATMAIMAIRSHTLGFGIALVFFGVECVILGRLIQRSQFMPAAIGLLMQAAGICYVINSFALLLSPSLASRLFPAILLPALVAELSLAIWLLVKGVRPAQWMSAEAIPG